MGVRRGAVPLLALLLTAFPVGSAPSIDAGLRRPATGAAEKLADGATRPAVLSLPSFRERGNHRPDGARDPAANPDPVRRVALPPPPGSAPPETAGTRAADPAPGPLAGRIPGSTSLILLATGLAGVAASRRRFKR